MIKNIFFIFFAIFVVIVVITTYIKIQKNFYDQNFRVTFNKENYIKFFVIFETSLLVFDRLKEDVNSNLNYFNYFVLYIKLYNDKNRNIKLNIVDFVELSIDTTLKLFD